MNDRINTHIKPNDVKFMQDNDILNAENATQRKIDAVIDAQQHTAAVERERSNPTPAPQARDHSGLVAQHDHLRGQRVTSEQALQLVNERLADAEMEITQLGYSTPEPTIGAIEFWCAERQRLSSLIAGCKQLRGMWAMAVRSGGY